MYEYKVSGMTCPSCAKAIARTLQRIDPKVEVRVDISRQLVRVDSSKNIEDIAQLINEAGYPVSESKEIKETA